MMKLNKKVLLLLLLFTTTFFGGLSLVQLRQKITLVGQEIKALESEIRNLEIELERKEKKLAELYRPTHLEALLGNYMKPPKPQNVILVKEESLLDGNDTIALIKMRRRIGEHL